MFVTVPYTPKFVFLYIFPISLPFCIVPLISPGFPFSPLLIDSMFAVISSPVEISTHFSVSMSDIPCPNAMNVFELGS